MESEAFFENLHGFLTVKEGVSKIIPSFFTIKEGSTSLTKPLSCPKRENVTALSADFSTSPSLLQGRTLKKSLLGLW